MREYGRGIIGAEVSRDNREMPKSTDEKITQLLGNPLVLLLSRLSSSSDSI